MGNPALNSAPRCLLPGLSQQKSHLPHLPADVPAALPSAAQEAGGHCCRMELIFPRIPGKSRGNQLSPRNNLSAKLSSSSYWTSSILCWTTSPACPGPPEWQHSPLPCSCSLWVCITCKLLGVHCPGHSKDVEQCWPQYQPLSAPLGTGL